MNATVCLTEKFLQPMMPELLADFAWICISILHIRNVVKTDAARFKSFKYGVQDYTRRYESLLVSKK